MDTREGERRFPADGTAESRTADNPTPDNSTWTITDLAREFDLTTRAIRFYEDQKLIAPARRGQTRIYGPRDRTRLKLILRGKRLGFSLGEIAEIIGLYEAEPGEVGQLEFFLRKIAERRRQLDQQREDIEVTLEELKAVEANCQRRLKDLRGKQGKRPKQN